MKTFFSFILIFTGVNASAQTLASTTEAGAALCLTCANTTAFIPMSIDNLKQLDRAMSGVKSTSVATPLVFDLATTKRSLPTANLDFVPAETEQERHNRIYRVPFRAKKAAETSEKSKKIELLYVVDPAQTSILNFGLNRNDRSDDPSIIEKQKKGRKILGLKYTKKF